VRRGSKTGRQKTECIRCQPVADASETSKYAARELAAMGYTNVAHYPEGKQGWMEAGLPVEKAA
jgi:hypothetical protein